MTKQRINYSETGMLAPRSCRTTWFLRKAAASSLEHRLVLLIRSLRCRVLVCRAADTASLAT